MAPSNTSLLAQKWIPFAVLMVALLLTFWVLNASYNRILGHGQEEFARQCDRLQTEIERRFKIPVYGLKGARGVFAASEEVKRLEFQSYANTRNLITEFPGVTGYGFIRRIPRENLKEFIDEQRKDDAPAFAVNSTGSDPLLYVVTFIEPLAPNRPEWGLDFVPDPQRRAALEESMNTGEPVMTRSILLHLHPEAALGFLLVAPVFPNVVIPPENEREEKLMGWVYCPISIEALMAGAAKAVAVDLDFEIFQDYSDNQRILYDDDGHLLADSHSRLSERYSDRDFHKIDTLVVNGVPLTLAMSTRAEFDELHYFSLIPIGLCGLLLSGSLASLVWLLSSSNERAQALAQTMTDDLRASRDTAHAALERNTELNRELAANEVLLRQFIQHTPAAIAILDKDMRYLQVSQRWIEDYKLSGQDVVGKSHYEVFPDCPSRWKDTHKRVLNGAVERCENDPFERADGGTEWLQWEARPWNRADGSIGGLIFFTLVITERKELERRLRDSEERFELAARGAVNGIWDWNVVTGEFYHSDRWCELLGYLPGQLAPVAETRFSLVHPEDASRVQNALRRHLNEHVPYDIECRMRMQTGEYRWFRTGGQARWSNDGTPVRMAGSLADITDRKRAEERFRVAVEAAHCAMIMVDQHGMIVLVNRQCEEIFGFTRDELLDKPVEALVPEEFREPHAALRRSYAEKPFARTMGPGREVTGVRKNGSKVALEIGLNPIRTEEGFFIIASAMDITERKRIESELYDSEERYRLMVETVEDYAIFMLDTQGYVTNWNKGAERTKGYSAEEIVGRHISCFYSEEDISAGKPEHNLAVAATTGYFTEESWRIRKGGMRFMAHVVISAVRDDDGGLVGFSKVTRNITERKLAEDRMLEDLKEKEMLLKEIHHRVKNNMQIISSLLNLQASTLEDDTFTRLIDGSKARISAMALVHEQLYQTHDISGVAFKDYCERLTRALSESYRNPYVQIESDIDESVLSIDEAIPCALIANEWITNAFKYAFPDNRVGTITLSFRQSQEGNCISVEDNGKGLANDFQPSSVTTLGMVLVQTLASQLRGTFSFEKHPHTRFSVTFPVRNGGAA